MTIPRNRWMSTGGWVAGMGIVAGGVIATGGSVGWRVGSGLLGALMIMSGFALGGLAIASAVQGNPVPRTVRQPVIALPLLWAAAGLGALLLAVPFARAAERIEIGPVSSIGALGLLAAAALAGTIAGVVTAGLLERWFSVGLSRVRIAIIGVGWGAALAVAALVTMSLGVVLGELTKMVASPPLPKEAALVVGWALSGAIAGAIPGLLTRPLLGCFARAEQATET